MAVLSPLLAGAEGLACWSGLGLGAAILAGLYIWACGRSMLLPKFQPSRMLSILSLFALVPLLGAVQGAPPGGIDWFEPREALTAVLHLFAYGTIAWLAFELGQHRIFADRLLRWLAYGGAALALLGLLIDAKASGSLSWLRASGLATPAAYETYAALALLCALGLVLEALAETPDRRSTLSLTAVAAAAFGLLLAGSRIAVLSAALGLVLFLLAALWARLIRAGTALAALLLLGAAFAGAIGVHRALDAAWTGTVPRSAADVMTLMRRALPTTMPEHAAMLAVPAAVLFLAIGAAALRAAAEGLHGRRGGYVPVAGLAMIAVIALHAALDIKLATTALAMGLAAFLGMICAQSRQSPNRAAQRPKLRVVRG